MVKAYLRFAGKHPQFLLFGLLTAFFGNYGQSFFIAWFGKSFQTAFSLSSTEYGFAYSSATLVSGFCILYLGALLDKIALVRFTLLTALGLATACTIVFVAQEFWQLILALFLLRLCGQGLMYHIAFTSMARYFVLDRGKAIGIVGFGMPLGEAILPAVAVTLIATIGWRETWLVLACTLIFLFIPSMLWLLRNSAIIHQVSSQQPAHQPNSQPINWQRSQVIRDHIFWLLIPAVVAPAFIVTGIFIHQSALLESKGWSEQWFALSFTIYAISHLASTLVVGSLVDKFSGQQLLRFYLLPMLLGTLLLALPLNHHSVSLLFMLAIGVTIGASGPIVGSMWVEIYGNQHIGAIRSMVTSIMVVATAISPVLLGWLFDNYYNYQQVMIGLSCYLLTAWLLVDRIALKNIAKRTTIET